MKLTKSFLRIFQTIVNNKFRKIWICVSDLLGGIFYPYKSACNIYNNVDMHATYLVNMQDDYVDMQHNSSLMHVNIFISHSDIMMFGCISI